MTKIRKLQKALGNRLLNRHSINYDPAIQDANIKKLAEEVDYRGILLVYGKCDPSWIISQFRQYRRLRASNRNGNKVMLFGMYTSLPSNKKRVPAEESIFFINYKDKKLLDIFAHALP